MSKIIIQNLGFSYENELVLRDLNMRIDSGDFVCVLGESGCGKSTFLRLLAGLAVPIEGNILIDGEPVMDAGLDRGWCFRITASFPGSPTAKT